MQGSTPHRGGSRASRHDERAVREDGRPPVADEPARERLIKAVHARERFLEGILGTLEPFATVDGRWRITFANRAAIDYIGRPPSEVLGKDVRDLRRFGATERSADLLERAMTERVPVEVDVEDPARRRRYLAAVQPIDGEGLAIYLSDVTEQLRAHEALLESEERFRTLADQSPFLIWVTGPGGDIEFVNRPYREFFGVTEDDVRGQGWRTLVHPDDAEAYVEEFMTAVRERRTFSSEARVRDARGQWHWVDSHAVPRFSAAGEFLGMVGSSPDVTDRHRMEEALRGSEEMLRTVLDNSRDGISMLDLRTGSYVFMNNAQVALTGFTAEEIDRLSPQEALERVHPEDRHVTEEQQRRVATGQDTDEPVEYRWKMKSGEYRWLSEQSRFVRDEKGRPIALVGISRDITRRKRAAMARERQHLVLSGIATILQAALTAPGDEQLGDTCLRVVEQLTDSDFGFIGRTDEHGQLCDVALSGPGPHAAAAWGRRGDLRPQAGSQTCGLLDWVVVTGESR
ncbi:MAG: PAS domain S-box protein [Actinobacteria bacterium]|nr:PAS domain S-box protein [Actinomycetota bacterium]